MNDASRKYRQILHQLEHSAEPGGPNTGDWVLVAVMGDRDSKRSPLNGIPCMEPRKRMMMRQYGTAEEALAGSVAHSQCRVYGGWALNLRTGETVRVERVHFNDHTRTGG